MKNLLRRAATAMLILWSFSAHAISKSEVYALLVKHDVKHPQIVLKQAVLETGHFKSKAFRCRNNLFGICGGEKRFRSIESCILYYKKWQKRRYKGGDYYVFLKRVPVFEAGRIVKYLPYAEDKLYITKLKRIKQRKNI